MANLKKRLPENVSGEFFVDSTCIDCDTCRQIAPTVFAESDDYSYVYAQPQTETNNRLALQALLSCPTGSIGTLHKNNASAVMADFPVLIEGSVYYCGFNSPKSYGGNSYFIKHPQGNWLVDSPKFLPHLVKQFEKQGGLRYIFLTHRDDVAEAQKYAEYFDSERIIHKFEISAQPDAERVIEGTEPVTILKDFVIIPTPGHTRGHCVLLFQNKFLFTGDHLSWSRSQLQLSSSEDYCWYSWEEQKKSIQKLLSYSFEWVLPGHGQRVHLSPKEMNEEFEKIVAFIKV